MHACPPRELLSFMLRSMRAAPRVAEAFRPNVVCAFFAIPGGPAAWRLMRRQGIPYVLSLRGSDVPRAEIAKYQRLHRFTRPFLRRMLCDAAGIAAVSQGLRNAALALDPDLDIQVIPNGVNTAFFRAQTEKAFPQGRHELLFVGRLQEFKGVQHVIRALPLIEKELDQPVLMNVVGEGPYREQLESIAERIRSAGARSEVRFPGWLDQDALLPIYESASVFILPSAVEGHPNVLLEAMAMGLPSVVSDAPGPKEVVNDGCEGLLAPPGDERAIARAVVQILKDEHTWREMSRCARHRAEEFSWDSVSEAYDEILERAATSLTFRHGEKGGEKGEGRSGET